MFCLRTFSLVQDFLLFYISFCVPNMSHLYTVHTNVNTYYESYKSQFRSKYQIRQKSPYLDDWQIKLCNILEILFLFRHPCDYTNQDAEFLKLLPLQSDFERLKEMISLMNEFVRVLRGST